MKTVIKKLFLFAFAPIFFSCSFFYDQSTPKGYVRYCVHLLDKDGLYANTDQWKTKKEDVLSQAKSITTMDEAHSLVQEAARVAGGKHSFIRPPVDGTLSYEELAPEVKMLEEGIIHVILPPHEGVKVSDSLYIHTVYDFLQEHLDAKGVIVDLRTNTGGNMYPMITSVSPLIPDGIALKFQSSKRTMPLSMDIITSSFGLSSQNIVKFSPDTPVAILTGDHTASSGEATLLCFRGLENAKTFGAPSAGYASGNTSHILSDGYLLAITQYSDVARTGETFCEDPISPDIHTQTPLEDAVAWILSK